jgi:hypothetical protein
VVSTDGLIGKEAKTLIKWLSLILAEKWEKPYAEVCGYVNARMSIAIVRATHRCLRGSRVPTGKMSEKHFPQWEDRNLSDGVRDSSHTQIIDSLHWQEKAGVPQTRSGCLFEDTQVEELQDQ